MPTVWDQAAIEQVQAANNIVDVISEYVNLTKKGREMVGLCPFHDDHRPSLYVNQTKQIFKCFACGAGGDVLKFVQLKEGLTFPQALERLAQRAGIQLARSRLPLCNSGQTDPNALVKVNEWAARFFQLCLEDSHIGNKARQYLESRQISQDSIDVWRLGYAPANQVLMAQAARRRGIPGQVLMAAGLIDASGRPRFVDRIMFPIQDPTGRVVGFGGRTLADDPAKYINSPNTAIFNKGNCIYGLFRARQSIARDQLVVAVEGYTDCIMAHQFGCTHVVATLGTSLTTGHGQILRRYANRIVLLFDGDAAGLAATQRALEVCLRHRVDIGIATVPDGLDPCDFLVAYGKEAFEQLISKAVDVVTLQWQQLQERFSVEQGWAARRTAVEQFLQTIAMAAWAGHLSLVDRGLLVNRLTSILGLDARQIDAELTRRIRAIQKDGPVSRPEGPDSMQINQDLLASAQREVLEVLLNAPQLYERVRDSINLDDFQDPGLRPTAALVFGYLGQMDRADGQAGLPKALIARTDSVEIASLIAELAQVGERKGNFQARLDGALEVLINHRSGGRIGTDNRRRLGLV